jgi:hypothetical protein
MHVAERFIGVYKTTIFSLDTYIYHENEFNNTLDVAEWLGISLLQVLEWFRLQIKIFGI